MSKLKNIIKQLSETDYRTIYNNLIDNSAEKSAFLLKFLKEKLLTDAKIMAELDVNPNAYYTLRSRLNERIEEYLVKQMESPKTDILKKVFSINEILFTKKRTIVIATLKKLEKELIDFDLSNDLIIIYKQLKKLHLNTPEHYHYSQLYNKHVAYNLALDKAEDILADYFKKYGNYFLNGYEQIKIELKLIAKELNNIARLYQSHRLFVYSSCVNIFHRIFIDPNDLDISGDSEENESIDELFIQIDQIMIKYSSDATYHHLQIVFDFLKLLYNDSKQNYRKSEKNFDDVNENASAFVANYSLYTFTPLFLISKIVKNSKLENENESIEEYKTIFLDYEADPTDLPKFIIYFFYKTHCYFIAGKYEMASKVINTMLNEVSLKRFPETYLEIKTFLALIYCLMDDFDLFNQLMNSIQRQIRLMGKKEVEHIVIVSKIMKISLSTLTVKTKAAKIKMWAAKMNLDDLPYFTPFRYVLFKDKLLTKLSA